jgi:hypothetical protein
MCPNLASGTLAYLLRRAQRSEYVWFVLLTILAGYNETQTGDSKIIESMSNLIR